jgi:putative toxin-antitoxin system antitoxin component (TIGR02293 family)
MQEAKTLDLEKLDYADDESRRAFLFFMPEKWANNWENCADRFDVINNIREGIPREAVNLVLEKTSISRNQLSHILHISTRQLNRYEHDERLSAEQSGFLYEFSRIYVRGLDIFGDKETFEKWLQRPQMALGEQGPLNLLDTTEGSRVVNDLLSQVEYGFYS